MEPSKNQAASGKARVRGRGRRSVKAKNLVNQNLKRGRINGTTYRKVARVEGRGRPSLKSISNSDEEKNASFEVDEGTGVPSPKPQPLENIWIDEASPKSGSPVTEPQQPLTDEEDLSYMNSHLTYEQMLENLKKLDERMLAESESESDDNGMQCNCDFNNCTCLKSYREYLAHDYADYADELDFRVR